MSRRYERQGTKNAEYWGDVDHPEKFRDTAKNSWKRERRKKEKELAKEFIYDDYHGDEDAY